MSSTTLQTFDLEALNSRSSTECLLPLLQGQTGIAKLKSAYNLLIIGPRGLQCKTNLKENMGWQSFDVVRFDLGPLLQGQMRIAKFKSAYSCCY